MIPEDRPTIDERYAAAMESSDLSPKPYRCDLDYLVAAGFVHESLGTMLYRLKSEWDMVRQDLRRAEVQAAEGARETVRLRRRAATKKGEDAAKLLDRAEALQERTKESALTERALVLAHLKTLSATREALHAYAIAFGTRTRVFDLDMIRHVVGKALQLWLDPRCPHCEGRGYTGGFTTPHRWCEVCVRTGQRVNGNPGFRLYTNDHGHQWGRALLLEMDRKADNVTAHMRVFMHARAVELARVSPAAAAGLKARLSELRSTEAEAD